ncbi:unnamed protein product [Mytilus coruscus]|uniref:Uncharacterized protein n=1 Tax=Mytilus coruscus TaxID=42192 RepID=A0A6J8BBM8_MYTCO|nr:unnamed protein product [Mytilus coruscus]
MDFDTIEIKEKDNYARSSLLVVQYTKDGLADLIEHNLKLTGHSSFQEFINYYQHDLYHLCYNQVSCCQCSRNYKLPKEQLIHPKQLEVLFDKSGLKKSSHNSFRLGDYCCCLAKQNLSTSVLDVTLASCLLFNFCEDVFWYSCLDLQTPTLEEFLNQNKHTLYHLYDISRRCCQCPPSYRFPSEKVLIDEPHWKDLFGKEIMACIRHKKRPIGKRNICTVSSTAGILVSHLDSSISKILLENCCSLWKTIEKRILIRDTLFADVDEAKLPENIYITYKARLEYGITVMARVCNKEREVTEKLKTAEKRKIDEIKMVGTIKRQISCTGKRGITEPSFIIKQNKFKRQKLILRRQSTVGTSEPADRQEHTEDSIYQRRIKSTKRSKIKSPSDETGSLKYPIETGSNITGTSILETKSTTVKDDIEIQGYKGVKNGGFYQINIASDDIAVDCIVDARLKIECKESVKEFQGCTYTAEIIQWRESACREKTNDTFINFVRKRKALLCQYFLNHTPIYAIENHILVHVLYISITNNDVETAKFIGWRIARNFLKSVNLHVYDIWLASLCRCSRRKKAKLSSWFCSTNVSIIIMVPQLIKEIENNFEGIPIKQIAFHCKIFKEAQAISNERTKLGAIPIGEKHFPSELQGIPTDVIEGFPMFCSQNIRIGDSVTNLKVSGTLGGFCHFYGREAFLTCAHAMMDWNTLLSAGHQHHMQPESVHFQTGGKILDETLHCGRVVNHSFTHDNPREISTDVAVIELDNGISVSEVDYVNTKGNGQIHYTELGLRSRYLHDSYIKTYQLLPGRNVQVVFAGAISDLNSRSSMVFEVPEKVLEREDLQSASINLANCITEKLQTQVNLPVHMQVHTIVCTSRAEEVKSQRTLRFYNQLALNNIPFQQGDSGACVYITDGYIETGCLGMAIADYPGGGCIVTPMATLLERLSLI